jgi:hypothetical protein
MALLPGTEARSVTCLGDCVSSSLLNNNDDDDDDDGGGGGGGIPRR